jgi:hypothetical protein
MSARSTVTPAGAVVRGVVAGAVGTLGMDLALYAKYRVRGGTDGFKAWELSAGISDWEQAPAPAQVGRRLVEGLFQRDLPPERAALVNNVTHWGYGLLGSVQYAIVVGSLSSRGIARGLPFGALIWGAGYVVLPAAKLYQPIWEYDRKTLAEDLGAHLIYGLGTAIAFKRLTPSRGEGS